MKMVIIGLDNIAAEFGKTRQTIARWIRKIGFPACRLPDGRWMTTLTLIDSFVLARNKADSLLAEYRARGSSSQDRQPAPQHRPHT